MKILIQMWCLWKFTETWHTNKIWICCELKRRKSNFSASEITQSFLKKKSWFDFKIVSPDVENHLHKLHAVDFQLPFFFNCEKLKKPIWCKTLKSIPWVLWLPIHRELNLNLVRKIACLKRKLYKILNEIEIFSIMCKFFCSLRIHKELWNSNAMFHGSKDFSLSLLYLIERDHGKNWRKTIQKSAIAKTNEMCQEESRAKLLIGRNCPSKVVEPLCTNETSFLFCWCFVLHATV